MKTIWKPCPEAVKLAGVLRRWRKVNKVTQAALAAKLKVEPSYINLLEGSHREPSFKMLVQLAKVTGLSISEMTGV